MKVTIKEIAKKAGVHRATVDKVLHNRVGVSDEVRKKVQSIIDEMGYTPNPAGRLLQKQGKVYRIAAILVDVDALTFLKAGIEQGVREQTGFEIDVKFYISKFQDVEHQKKHIELAIAEQVDGIILSAINAEPIREAIDRATQSGIPVVITNTDIDRSKRLCCVSIDSVKASRIAGRMMGQFLSGSGKVAIISSAVELENNNYYVIVREKGFTEFIKSNYQDIELTDPIESFEDPKITYEKTVELLKNEPDLKGIYITCGGVAQVGRALEESGRAIDIRVVCFEDYPEIVELMKRDVVDCTLAGEIQRQGELPVQIIMDNLIFGKKPQTELVQTEIRILVKESLD